MPDADPQAVQTGKNIFARGSDFVAAHSAGCFALIIVLVIICIIFSVTYFRKNGRPFGMVPKQKQKLDEDVDDPEITTLVNTINAAR